MESVIKNYGGGGVTIASKEIDCADRIIVHETGIHKDIIVDSSNESDCVPKYWRVKIVLINSDTAI